MSTTEAVKGLRDLANFIEQHPGIDWPYIGAHVAVVVGNGEQMAAFAAVPGGWGKNAYDTDNGGQFTLTRSFGPVTLSVIARRDQVCERIVVGVELVEVPGPTVVAEREAVEWVCSPLLAKASA